MLEVGAARQQDQRLFQPLLTTFCTWTLVIFSSSKVISVYPVDANVTSLKARAAALEYKYIIFTSTTY